MQFKVMPRTNPESRGMNDKAFMVLSQLSSTGISKSSEFTEHYFINYNEVVGSKIATQRNVLVV